MKLLAALLLAASLALSACDGHNPSTGDGAPEMRGAAGAAGGAGMSGAGGAGYVPDPAPTCDQPTTSNNALIVCDAGGGNAPTFNAQGTQCYSCVGWPVPAETGCAIRLPEAISGGQVIHGPRDIFCPPNPCDPTLCHVK